MNAQVKPNERAALEVKLVNRRADVFEIEKAKAREGLQDDIQEAVDLFLDQILANYTAGDDCANGQIIGNVIATCGMRLTRGRQAEELRDAFLPSWRSRAEP